MTAFTQQSWKQFCEQELAAVTPFLAGEGYALDPEQPHIRGERYVFSGPKLVLFGTRVEDKLRVVIKITRDSEQVRELEMERTRRELFKEIDFAYRTFAVPPLVVFGKHGAYTFMITEFIPQEKRFLDRSLPEQFFLALTAFEAQEGSHAATYEHLKRIKNTFEVMSAEGYANRARSYRKDVVQRIPEHTAAHEALARAGAALLRENELVERYCGFLTHWDFVPHNIRIHKGEIYLLDHTSIRFGNKYEGWARFLNFMALYHPELEEALLAYVRDNRRAEEVEVLRLMRLYRLSELIHMYAGILGRAEGDLVRLTNARIGFWTALLEAQLNAKPVYAGVVEVYKNTRDSLRDEDELKRQKDLH